MDDATQTIPDTDNSGGSALIGALLGGSLGALGGGLYADVDETATPSEKLKQRLQTAALVGALGAAGGAGTGFLFGNVVNTGSDGPAPAGAAAPGTSGGAETWGDVANKYVTPATTLAIGNGLRRGLSDAPGKFWNKAGKGAASGGLLGLLLGAGVTVAQDHGVFGSKSIQ